LAFSWLWRVWGRLGHEDNTLDGIVDRAAMEHTHCAEGEDGEVATQDWTLLANNASPVMQLEFVCAEQPDVFSAAIAVAWYAGHASFKPVGIELRS